MKTNSRFSEGIILKVGADDGTVQENFCCKKMKGRVLINKVFEKVGLTAKATEQLRERIEK